MAKRFLSTIQAITATFTGNVTAANPTLPQHLATKEYVDGTSSSLSVGSGSSYPTSASNGQLFYNTTSGRTAIYFSSAWKEFVYVADSLEADGGNASTTIFSQNVDGGLYSDTLFIGSIDGGAYSDNPYITSIDGGSV